MASKKLRKFSLQVLVFLKVHLYQKTYHEKIPKQKLKRVITSKNPDQTKNKKSSSRRKRLRKQKVTRKKNCMCSIKGHAFSRWILSPGPDWKTLVTTSTYFENGSFS